MERNGYKYQDAGERLKKLIETIDDGDKLPNRKILSEQLGIARTTLEHSIAELIASGYLSSRGGSGTYVRKAGIEENAGLQELNALKFSTSHFNKKTWAILCSSILGDIYPYIIRAVQDVAARHGINVIVCSTDNDTANEQSCLIKLVRDGVSGIIIIPATHGDINPLFYRRLQKTGVKLISCYRPLVGFLTPGVYCNSFESGYVATKFLLDRGCKKIAYFSAPIYQTAYDRYQGFMMALASSGVAQDSHAVFMDSFTYDLAQCYRTILPSFDQYGIPDGIFAFNDRLAQLVYQALEIRHLRPGRDVKVIGCDNNNLCSELDPRLTSIELPVYEAGRRAAEMLWQYVNDEAVPTSHVFCESCKVIERAST